MTVFLKTKDYFNTKEEFWLEYDSELEMLITKPIPKDIDRYYNHPSYISHTDQNKSVIDKIYQFVKKYSLNKKVKLITELRAKEKKVLDIGAGTGDFLKSAKKNNWLIDGIEPNETARTIAKNKKIELKTNLNDVENDSYDVVTLWHVLEHLPNLKQQIVQINHKLKENGYLIIAVPNFKSYDAQYYKEHWAAYDTPRHLWHFSKKSIHSLFLKHGLKVKKVKPMVFDSFYVSMLSEKYKTGHSNFIKAFTIGFISNLKALYTKEYSSLIYILKKEV